MNDNIDLHTYSDQNIFDHHHRRRRRHLNECVVELK
jgi:hypothetical protein